ncbi:MAG: hypothetical protein HYT66_00495 [Candidatus Yanofskybacteria bacterium]|nr:hypothetical protein [Candidatus Yanofskybacteria bacterium]
MPETGVLLKDYVLPVVVVLELICTIIGGIFVVASMVVGARSLNRRRKNRIEELSWRLKSMEYIKTWTLLFMVCCVFGVVISLIADEKALLYLNFLAAVLFLMLFLGIRRMHELVSKELNSVKAILNS